MKRMILTTLLGMLGILPVEAQLTLKHHFNYSGTEDVTDAVMKDGYLWMSGSYNTGSDDLPDPTGGRDAMLMQVDTSTYSIERIVTLGGILNDEGGVFSQHPSGNICWTAAYTTTATIQDTSITPYISSRAVALVGMNEQTSTQWIHSLAGNGLPVLTDIIAIDDGYVAVGYSSESMYWDDTLLVELPAAFAFILKLDLTGQLVQEYFVPTSGALRPVVVMRHDERLYVAGDLLGSSTWGDDTISSGTVFDDVFISCVSLDLEPIWARRAGGFLDAHTVSLSVLSDAMIGLSGNFAGILDAGQGIRVESLGFEPDWFSLEYSIYGDPLRATRYGSYAAERIMDYAWKNSDIYIGTFEDTLRFDQDYISNSPYAAFLARSSDGTTAATANTWTSDGLILPRNIIEVAANKVEFIGVFTGNMTVGLSTAHASNYDIFWMSNDYLVTADDVPWASDIAWPNDWLEWIDYSWPVGATIQLFDMSGRSCPWAQSAVNSLPQGYYILVVQKDKNYWVQRVFKP